MGASMPPCRGSIAAASARDDAVACESGSRLQQAAACRQASRPTSGRSPTRGVVGPDGDQTENDAVIAACLAEDPACASRDEYERRRQLEEQESWAVALMLQQMERDEFERLRQERVRAAAVADEAAAGREPRLDAGRQRTAQRCGGRPHPGCLLRLPGPQDGANVLLVPCGHRTVCRACARKLRPPRCPVCRHDVQQISVIG
ncbi:unnamed protein product [Prorocentrum cordatum]|uniref:RING-type domain-containing protein n=1 Tax=Prorocentrum cordatum TaxID=2364126 RepID=A0ABN9TL89_9DINO|nr:unnamed protein product [Polarella glacialis]